MALATVTLRSIRVVNGLPARIPKEGTGPSVVCIVFVRYRTKLLMATLEELSRDMLVFRVTLGLSGFSLVPVDLGLDFQCLLRGQASDSSGAGLYV